MTTFFKSISFLAKTASTKAQQEIALEISFNMALMHPFKNVLFF